jgi:CRISPR-associated Cas5-like protein
MNLDALTFVVRFQTAQFKLHFQKLARRTYLIPPPSAVAGFLGAMMGVERGDLKNFCKKHNLLAGAELRHLEGFYATISRVFKFDRDKKGLVQLMEEFLLRKPIGKRKLEDVYKDMLGLLPLKESEELFKPEYKFAIVAEDTVVKECLRRLLRFDFMYDVFGGNDYHFLEYIGNVRRGHFIKSKKGGGYCPAKYLERIEAEAYTLIADTSFIPNKGITQTPMVIFAQVGPDMEDFAFAYRTDIVATQELGAVSDGESTIFVYDPTRYLI